MKLRHVVDVRNSNVDKVIVDGEQPVRLCNYVDVYKNDFIDDGMEFSAGSATAAEIANFALRDGDVIVTKDSEDRTDIGVPALVRSAAPDLVCGYHLSMLRAKPGVAIGSFLFWALLSKPAREAFSNAAYGITRYGMALGGMKDVTIPLPDLAAQKAIVDFLDRETARIDQLIEKKQRLVEVLGETRYSVISRGVTTGVGSSDRLVPTNSPYLPEIPEGWRIWRLKQLAEIRGGLTLGRSVPEATATERVPYLRVANVQAGWLDLHNVYEIDATLSEISRFSLVEGDVLMNEGGDNNKLGRGAVWEAPFSPCLNQNHVFCVRPKKRLHADWISLATNARYARDFFYLHSNQSTNLASISKTNLARFPIVMPPDDAIADLLDIIRAKLGRIEQTISQVSNSIDRLREYRAALITAAVTGQIDVATYGKQGATDRRLDRIEEEMQA